MKVVGGFFAANHARRPEIEGLRGKCNLGKRRSFSERKTAILGRISALRIALLLWSRSQQLSVF
jgi:hypothetical protein